VAEVDLTAVEQSLWHVTVTLTGDPVPADELRTALNRLIQERPFMLSIRYATDRVELRFWDEAEDVDDAAALALRLWGDHRASAGLPSWRVVGLEVLDRDTLHARNTAAVARPLVAAGVSPL
jgi:hypothetical protein